MIKKIAVLTSGISRGSNFTAIADYFSHNNIPIEIGFIVITRKSAPVIDKAEQRNIESVHISTKDMDVFEQTLLKHCMRKKIALIALAGFLKKLSPGFISTFDKPILNIHPALLPNYGGKGMYGLSVHQAVYQAGDQYSGATIHYVNESYDEGDILAQKTVDISDCLSAEEIAQKVLKIEHRIYAPAIIKALEKTES